jgi:hypothetical protein
MATKGYIAAQQKLALLRLVEALREMGRIVHAAEVEVSNIHFRRDPNYERMMRYVALADWAEGIADGMREAGLDIAYAQDVNDRLTVIREVLDQALHTMTKANLEVMANDHEIPLGGLTLKEEYIVAIIAFLTGAEPDAGPDVVPDDETVASELGLETGESFNFSEENAI